MIKEINLYHYKAKVVRVVDGDTIKVDIDLGFGLHNKGTKGKGATLRFNNYNAPESRGEEKELGKVATKYLKTLLPVGSELIIHTLDVDSFGRWLADIYFFYQVTPETQPTMVNLINHLVEQGYGVCYDGKGKRSSFKVDLPYPVKIKHEG